MCTPSASACSAPGQSAGIRSPGVAPREGERTVAGPVRSGDRVSERRAQRAIFRAMKKLVILEKEAPNR
jgi:hypothetical protein